MTARKDCCPGEPCLGDPRGMHSLDCPVYLASMEALEAGQRRLSPGDRLAASGLPLAPGGIVRPSGESTLAALRRVTGELEDARRALAGQDRELDGLNERYLDLDTRCDQVRQERDAARAEVDRLGLSLLKSGQANDALLAGSERLAQQCQLTEAELSTARRELELLRRQLAEARTDADVARDELASAARSGWIVARDGGRTCLDCGREIRRGEAYELVPGEGLDALRHVHCRDKEKSMITEDEARMIGKAIRDEAGIVALPSENPTERRAICLKFAIETKGVAFSLKNDSTVVEAARQVLEAARLYHAFVSDAEAFDVAGPFVHHGEQGEPWWNAAAEQYEATCLCGESFADDRAGGAHERLLVHLGREATDV